MKEKKLEWEAGKEERKVSRPMKREADETWGRQSVMERTWVDKERREWRETKQGESTGAAEALNLEKRATEPGVMRGINLLIYWLIDRLINW